MMRSEGVLVLKQGQTELTLAPAALFPRIKSTTDTTDKIATDENYSEDDLIDWSNISAGIEAN